MVLVSLLYCSFSYTETITGQTTNAAASSTQWLMKDVLPQYTGLIVNSVSYRYTAIKVPEDAMVVNVQNLNAQGDGYIFRSRDDWTGLRGNTITKTVPVDNIPIQYWGPGEIAVEGKGQVANPNVIYGFRYDTCSAAVITDPKCPNYKPFVPEIKYDDPLNDEYLKKSLERPLPPKETDEEIERRNKLLERGNDLQKKNSLVAKTVQNSLLTAEAISLANALEALNRIPNINGYYKAIPGGTYQEPIRYVDKSLPDNRAGRRLNFSQEQLHNQMKDMQYEKVKEH